MVVCVVAWLGVGMNDAATVWQREDEDEDEDDPRRRGRVYLC